MFLNVFHHNLFWCFRLFSQSCRFLYRSEKWDTVRKNETDGSVFEILHLKKSNYWSLEDAVGTTSGFMNERLEMFNMRMSETTTKSHTISSISAKLWMTETDATDWWEKSDKMLLLFKSKQEKKRFLTSETRVCSWQTLCRHKKLKDKKMFTIKVDLKWNIPS